MARLDKIASFDQIKGDKIGIIGYPGAGKTTLSNRFKDRPIIHTDDYLSTPHDDRPKAIMKCLPDKYVVEGNEVTRLVNRGLVLDSIILAIGSDRNEKSIRGLQGRVDNFIRDYPGVLLVTNPRRLP